jgi:hypothetical protein
MSIYEDSKNEQELMDSIDSYIEKISEGHRMHRKIQFLLDIRGLIIINKIQGDYVEFGVYRGEMMYSAAKILSPHIRKYIGLDTFTGLPEPVDGDSDVFVFKDKGFMSSPKSVVEKLMEGFDTCLIEGDFRDKATMDKLALATKKIAVLSIDCNWPSSIKVAMEESVRYMQHGTIIFLDDYFAGVNHRNFHDQLLEEFSKNTSWRFIEFSTYPPAARAFLVEAK